MEQNSLRQPLLLEKAARWLVGRMRADKVPLLSSAIFGALAYLFAFSNKLVNHDEVFCLFSKGETVTSGRWGLGALDSIFPNYSMPWIYGVITIALIAAAICLIIHILAIQSKLLQVLLAGSIVVFPSLIGTFGYMFTSSSYGISFLLAVLAAWLAGKTSRWYAFPSIAVLVLSLSIYQPYVSLCAGLLLLILIRQLMLGEKLSSVICRGVYFVAILLISMVLYYMATKIVLYITGNAFNAYASDNLSMSLSSILSGIGLAYSRFLCFFAEDCYAGLISSPLSRLLHILALAASGVLLLIWGLCQQKKSASRFLLLALLIALLPLAINCMYLIIVEDAIHTLVLYGFVSVYILMVLLADLCLPLVAPGTLADLCRRLALDAVVLAMAVILTVNVYTANEAYLNLYLRYENAYAFYTALVADIKLTPGFTEDTRLAIIGTWQEPDFYSEQFGSLEQLTGVTGFTANSYARERFLQYYLGFSISFATDEEIAAIQSTPEYEAMATYPYYGSMAIIGDFLVVKLS